MLFESRRTYDILVQNFGTPKSQHPEIAPASQRLEIHFLDNVPVRVALEAHKQGYLTTLRAYLRRTWRDVTLDGGDTRPGEIPRHLLTGSPQSS
jgi:hypothetical protein